MDQYAVFPPLSARFLSKIYSVCPVKNVHLWPKLKFCMALNHFVSTDAEGLNEFCLHFGKIFSISKD